MVRRAVTAAVDFFWPVPCAACELALRPGEQGFCTRCTGAMQFWHNEPGASIRHVVRYDGPGGDAIRRLKYGRRTALARPLAALLAAEIQSPDFPAFDYIVPIPLHWKRELARGFNQSVLLAFHCSAMTGVPFIPDALIRVRSTVAQIELGRTERQRNMRGAFLVPHPDIIHNRRILLIDDVHTTGATTGEASRAIRRAGDSFVTVLTVAKQS